MKSWQKMLDLWKPLEPEVEDLTEEREAFADGLFAGLEAGYRQALLELDALVGKFLDDELPKMKRKQQQGALSLIEDIDDLIFLMEDRAKDLRDLNTETEARAWMKATLSDHNGTRNWGNNV